jgi:hypothetical protein
MSYGVMLETKRENKREKIKMTKKERTSKGKKG